MALTFGDGGLAWADSSLQTWGDVATTELSWHCNAVQPWFTTQCPQPSRPYRGRTLDRAGLFHGCVGGVFIGHTLGDLLLITEQVAQEIDPFVEMG